LKNIIENPSKLILFYSCPFFRNEIGGEADRNISISASSGLTVQVGTSMLKTLELYCFVHLRIAQW